MLTKIVIKNNLWTLDFDLKSTYRNVEIKNFFDQRLIKSNYVNKGLIYGEMGSGKTTLLKTISFLNRNVDFLLFSHLYPFTFWKITYFFNFDGNEVIYQKEIKDCENEPNLIHEKLKIEDFLLEEENGFNLINFIDKIELGLISSISKNLDNEEFIKNKKASHLIKDQFLPFVNNICLLETKDSFFQNKYNELLELKTLYEKQWNDYLLKNEMKFLINKDLMILTGGEMELFCILMKCFEYEVLKKENGLLLIDNLGKNLSFDKTLWIFEKLKSISNMQLLATTNQTFLMSNEETQPDCVFILKDQKIKSLNNLTIRELRFAHNIERLYRAGHFDC